MHYPESPKVSRDELSLELGLIIPNTYETKYNIHSFIHSFIQLSTAY